MDRIGKLLAGKYRLEVLLACGGMGLVYGARHQTTGRAVAVKLLRPELVAKTDFVRRVAVEARLAVEASHPNVVEVLDAGADADGTPFLVLERLYGQTLEALLVRPLSLLTAAQAVVPVMNALVSLHDAGIVHRDIKPANLFLSVQSEGRVTPKLLDFGIAKVLEGATVTRSGIALGTPAYMAPEQALGCSTVGPATDVWAIGVVLARCLTGQLPFEGKASSRVGALRSGLNPEDLAGVVEPVARVLMQALRFEPIERFASMLEFRAALLGALNDADPTQNWPGAGSVSFATPESELVTWVNAATAEAGGEAPGAAELAEAAHGRSEDVATQTLASVWRKAVFPLLGTRGWHGRSGSRRSRSRGFAAYANLPARTARAPSPPEVVTAAVIPDAKPPSSDARSGEPHATAHASPATAHAEEPATKARRAVRSNAVGRRPSSPSKPPAAAEVKPQPAARATDSVQPAPAPRPVGANRSPIIE